MKVPRLLVLIVMPFVIFFGCSKSVSDGLTDEESRVYITNKDEAAVFNSYKSFSIVDSVLIYINNAPSRQLTDADVALLDAIKSQMQSRGYVHTEKSESPDLGINITKVDQRVSSVIIDPYPGSWATLPGYWDPGYWGWAGGYYYPPTFYVVSTKEEIIFIDLFDLKNAARNNNELNVIWNAQLRGPGVLTGPASVEGVEACFTQSPYLKTP